jgi:hypothetical protein
MNRILLQRFAGLMVADTATPKKPAVPNKARNGVELPERVGILR